MFTPIAEEEDDVMSSAGHRSPSNALVPLQQSQMQVVSSMHLPLTESDGTQAMTALDIDALQTQDKTLVCETCCLLDLKRL